MPTQHVSFFRGPPNWWFSSWFPLKGSQEPVSLWVMDVELSFLLALKILEEVHLFSSATEDSPNIPGFKDTKGPFARHVAILQHANFDLRCQVKRLATCVMTANKVNSTERGDYKRVLFGLRSQLTNLATNTLRWFPLPPNLYPDGG